MKPGIYDLPADQYYSDQLADRPTLNATVAKLLISASPLHAWTAHCRLNPDYHETVDKKFDVGTAAHEVWLLGNDHLVHVVDAADWRKKEAQEVRDRARAEGMIPLLAHEWQRVSAMLTAIREQLPAIDVSPPLFQGGKPERTVIWEDQGVLCRARLDYLHDDFSACDDLKTAGRSANPFVWTRTTLWSIGADIQAAMTIRAIKALTGVDTEFRFLVAETTAPYAVCLIALAPAALELANRKLDRALNVWRTCLEEDIWPAYPQQVCYAEPMPWQEADVLEREVLEQEAAAA